MDPSVITRVILALVWCFAVHTAGQHVIQSRVTDSDIVKLNEVVPSVDASSSVPIVSPTALQLSSWSFTLADAVLIAYASTDDRDVALQQITQVWEDALAPQVTDVQVVLVDDRPDLSNPTNIVDGMASIVTYAVLGNTPTQVEAWSAKENFRKLINATRIPVIPVNLTSTSVSYALLESLGLDYKTLGERDDLLQQIKVIWQKLLASQAVHVQMTLYNDAPVPGGSADRHYITYLITYESSSKLSPAMLEQEFRQKLSDSRLVGKGVWGISVTDTASLSVDAGTSTAATTIEHTKATTTVYVMPQEPFEIVDSVLLPYVSAAQVDQLLQQIKEYWIVVLGPRFVARDIRFINSSLENVTISGNVTLVYDITYEISGLTDTKVDVTNVTRQFHHAILQLLTLDESAPIVVLKAETTTSAPSVTKAGSGFFDSLVSTAKLVSVEPSTVVPSTTVVTLTASTASSSSSTAVPDFTNATVNVAQETTASSVAPKAKAPLPEPTTETVASTTVSALTSSLTTEKVPVEVVNQKIIKIIPAEIAVPRTTSPAPVISDLSITAAKNLIFSSLGGVDINKVHSMVFYENIALEMVNATDLKESMEAVKQLWIQAFGNDTVDVALTVYRNSFALAPTSARYSDVDYVVLLLTKHRAPDVVAAKNKFRELLSKLRGQCGVLSHVIKSSQLNNNVILDSVSVTSSDLIDTDQLVAEIRTVWQTLLGSDAEGVQVAFYRDVPSGPVGPVAGNADVHRFYYVIFVQTKKTDLDVDMLRDRAAELIGKIILPGITILPNPADKEEPLGAAESDFTDRQSAVNSTDTNGPLLGFAVHDVVYLNYTSDEEKENATEALRDLWKNVLGPDAMDVRIIVSNATAVNHSDSVHEIIYTMFVITKSTNYDQDSVKRIFHTAVLSKPGWYIDILAVPLTTAGRTIATTVKTVAAESSTSASTVAAVKFNSTFSSTEASANLESSEKFVEIKPHLIHDNVFLNYTTDLEREAALKILTQMWIDFLGVSGANVLDVQLLPYSDIKNDTSGLHTLSYILLTLSYDDNWDLEGIRHVFHDNILVLSNSTLVVPISDVGPVRKSETANLVVIPNSVSVAYSTKSELGSTMQTIEGVWRKVLASRADRVEVSVYRDTVSTTIRSASGQVIHEIFYVVTIWSKDVGLDGATLKSQFEQQMADPDATVFVPEQDTESTTDEVIRDEISRIVVGPVMTQPPPLFGLVISDHIWLIYKNETERSQYLDVMKSVWNRVLQGLNATKVSLVFDHENSDNSSSDRPDSHEVFYNVLAETHQPNLSIHEAKFIFRKELPAGEITFGFDPEDDDQLASLTAISSTEATMRSGEGKNFTTDGWIEVKPSGAPTLAIEEDPKTTVTDTALLQFADDEERDSELEEIKKIWSKVFALPLAQVHTQIIKDTIKSTDSSFRPASVHDVVYAITSPVNMSDDKYLEKWLSYEHLLSNLSFVVNASRLVAPAPIPSVFGIPVENSFRNASWVTIVLKKVTNDSSWKLPQNETEIPVTHLNLTTDVDQPRFHFITSEGSMPQAAPASVNGTFFVKYTNATEKDAIIQQILGLWSKQFGFNETVVNLTLSFTNSSSGKDNGSFVQEIHYKIWSPLAVNLAVIQTKFEQNVLSLGNMTADHAAPVAAGNLLTRTGDLFAILHNSTSSTTAAPSLNVTITSVNQTTAVRRFLNA